LPAASTTLMPNRIGAFRTMPPINCATWRMPTE
jgi:hypothetical protein